MRIIIKGLSKINKPAFKLWNKKIDQSKTSWLTISVSAIIGRIILAIVVGCLNFGHIYLFIFDNF